MFVFWFIFYWSHGDLIKWKYFLRYWPCVREIHRWLVVTHKGQWRGDLMFSFMCIWRKGWAKHQDGDDLSRHRAHHDIAVTLSLPQIGHKSVLMHVIVWCRRGDKPLQWRHNGPDGVSNHRRPGCLFNRLFRPRSKKTSKLLVTGPCAGNSPVTGEFPAQWASNAENVSIWLRHQAISWCNDDPVYWRLYVLPGRNELILLTSYAYIFTETSQLITTSKQHVSDIS